MTTVSAAASYPGNPRAMRKLSESLTTCVCNDNGGDFGIFTVGWLNKEIIRLVGLPIVRPEMCVSVMEGRKDGMDGWIWSPF